MDLVLGGGWALGEPPAAASSLGAGARWWLEDEIAATAWAQYQWHGCSEIGQSHEPDRALLRLGLGYGTPASVPDTGVAARALLSGGVSGALGVPVTEERASCDPSRQDTFPTHGEVGLYGQAQGELIFEGVFLLGAGILLEGRLAMGDIDRDLIGLVGVQAYLGVRF